MYNATIYHSVDFPIRILRELIHHMKTNYSILCASCKQGMSGRGKRRCLEPAFPPPQPLHQPDMPELLIKQIHETIHTYVQRDPTRRRLSYPQSHTNFSSTQNTSTTPHSPKTFADISVQEIHGQVDAPTYFDGDNS